MGDATGREVADGRDPKRHDEPNMTPGNHLRLKNFQLCVVFLTLAPL